MSDADKYLSELNRIAGKGKSNILKTQYKGDRQSDYGSLATTAEYYMKMSNEEAKEKEEAIRALARNLMEVGYEGRQGTSPNVTAALRGALLYEKIGKGKKAIPKLLKAAEKDRNTTINHEYKNIRAFIERNAGERQKTSSGIESRVGVFIAFLLGGVVLSLTSLGTTGHAVSDLAGTTQGLAGVFLFVLGLAGIVFGSRK